ncbi:MAG: hypothetical protein ACTS2F_17000 [Thainema sp.]
MTSGTPILFMPVEPDPGLADMQDPNAALSGFTFDELKTWYDNGTLRQSFSTNWYYLWVIRYVCEHYQESGLDFLQSEVAYLEPTDIKSAQVSLDIVKQETLAGFKNLPQHYQETSDIEFLQYAGSIYRNRRQLTPEQYIKLFEEVSLSQRYEDDSIEGFIYLLKALADTCSQCLSSGKHLFYIKLRA